MVQQVGEEEENWDPASELVAIEPQAFLCRDSLSVIGFASLVTLI
jgi:hypothetical protein